MSIQSTTFDQPVAGLNLQPGEQVALDLGTVQETLLTPLCARADQYGRTNAIVEDHAAWRLVEAIDYDFEKLRRYPNTMTGCAIRAARFDRWMQQFLSASEGDSTVALLGEGLDTTRLRNDDDGNDNCRVQWFELDFPDVIAHREKLFAPHDRAKMIGGDLFDFTWIDTVKAAAAGRVLFQIAGVTMYLPEQRIRELFTTLADNFPGCTVLFDVCSARAKGWSKRVEASVRTTKAEYKWGINDPRRIADWDSRLKVHEVEYQMEFHREQWTPAARVASRVYRPLRHAYQLCRAELG